jgi:hypothetical protein
MQFRNVATKLAFIAFAGMSLSGCLGYSRPDAAFQQPISANSPRGGAPVAIGGRVEASKTAIGTLERRVVVTANGSDVGRGVLPDARLSNAAEMPIAINGDYQGVPIAARCENHEFNEPAGERRGILHRLTFAEINCQVSYAGRPAGNLSMLHSPHGTIVQPQSVAAAR